MRKLKKYKPTRFMAKGSHYDKEAADFAVSFIVSRKPLARRVVQKKASADDVERETPFGVE